MGYSEYLVRIKKDTINEVRDFTYEDLLSKMKENKGDVDLLFDDSIYLPDLFKVLGGEQLYDFGKDFDLDLIKSVVKEHLFTNKDTTEAFNDYKPMILKDDAILRFINYYEEKVKRYNDLLLTEPEMYGDYAENPSKPNPLNPRDLDDILANDFIVKRIVLDFISKRRSWKNGAILNKHQDHESLTYSSLYEYSVFDLLTIHKQLDNEQYYYIFYGR